MARSGFGFRVDSPAGEPEPTVIPAMSFYVPPYPALQSFVSQYPELSNIANNPRSIWLGDWQPNPTDAIAQDKQLAGNKIITYVIYGAPKRDAGGYSAGGFADTAAYVAWIDTIVAAIGSTPVIICLEPDTLGQLDRQTPDTQAMLYVCLRQAVTKLKTNPFAKVFIDMGMWVPPATAAARLKNANIAAADGFSVNVSNFNALDFCHATANQFTAALASVGITGKQYIVDTARNGNGPLTADFAGSEPWISTSQTWCNPPGRGLGLTARMAHTANCYAYLWLKNPGESDGSFPSIAQNTYFATSAPAAGGFWLEYARDLCNHTPATFAQ